MATIRELFHDLSNKFNVITIGCGATKDVASTCLEIKELSDTLKADLSEIIKNLEHITNQTLEADKITTEIHDRVYKVIDPNTGQVKAAT